MVYRDMIYGDIQIDDQVVIDLLGSQSMQRLQGILQHGVTGLIGLTSPVTRFDHSVGVMILVKILGGSLKEQIAALLHDISHTAFSHVFDYVFDNHHNQSFHDEQKESFIANSDIPEILAVNGLNWQDFIDESKFSLLEQPAPRLCADRLDYFFRDSQDLNLASKSDIQDALSHLVVFRGRIATTNLESAKWLAYTYIAADDASWANFREVGLYELTALAIRRGLKIGFIDESDIWGTDVPLWRKMHTCPDEELQSLLQLISVDTKFVWDEKNPTFRVGTKVRTIDPDILIHDELLPFSNLDQEFKTYRQHYSRIKQGKWPVRVLSPRQK